MQFFRENVKAAIQNTIVAGAGQLLSLGLNNAIFQPKGINFRGDILSAFSSGLMESLPQNALSFFYAAYKANKGENLKNFAPGIMLSTFFQGVVLEILMAREIPTTQAIFLATAFTALALSLCEEIVKTEERFRATALQS